ncbi:MAG: LysM peptidoglycan-binding domain-containing protein [Verrucomicrobiaceae bacterium]|nr:LysM peptidoglycan-binding domain-containing protein [Verrucomicrobiaceae bacterium]
MAKAQFKLLIFLITVGLAGGSLAVAWWFWENVLQREEHALEDIAAIKKSDMPRIDPGAKRFEAAVDLIRQGSLEQGREALYRLLQQFPDSPSCVEARRIIGEMNLDAFFSPKQMQGKRDYIVQPGNGLALIASKFDTSIDLLVRLNNLEGSMLHPGDHLLVAPLDFDFGVDLSQKTVVIVRKGRFFKEYSAIDVRLPPNMRVPAELTIGMKSATIAGKAVSSTDPRYVEAEKWIPALKSGLIIRTVPAARAVVEGAPAGQPQEAAEYGVFLRREDLDEIYALTRSGAKLTIVR